MGEQPRVSLVAHVREIGEIEDGGDLEEKGSAGGDKQEQEKPSTTEPVMIAEGLRPVTKDCSEDPELGIYRHGGVATKPSLKHGYSATTTARRSTDNSV